VDARTHIITTIAGNGTSGWGGDGGPATAAELSGPNGVAEFNGQVFIADLGNCAIREVAVTGRITTVAGSGTHCGFGGDGGPAANAQLNLPEGVTADASGNLFIADYFNQRVRRVDHATAIISTVAGNGTAGFSGDGGPATGAEINGPVAAAMDSFGNLYVADNGNQRVRRVDHATATISTVAGNGTAGFSGDGGPAVRAEIAVPSSVAVDRTGDVLVADIGNGRIRRVDATTHTIGTVAGGGNGGDGGPAVEAEVGLSAAFVNGLALDPFGNVLVTDNDNNRIRRINVWTGTITDVAGSPIGALGFSGDGGPATRATMGFSGGVAADARGDIFIEDFQNARIRRVDAFNGIIMTVAGNGSFGFSGDGGPATSAALNGPEGVGVDPAGNVFIPDSGNSRIRRVDARTGIIATVAGNGNFGFSGDGGPATSASLNFPLGATADGAGNIYIADIGNNRVREVFSATGTIETVAGSGDPSVCGFSGDGGPATSAQLCGPGSVFVDRLGNIYITDGGNSRIRRVDHVTRKISTVAGNGTRGFTGDGGLATAAQLDSPGGIAVNRCGDLFIVDSGSGRVRKVESGEGLCGSGK
jgi:sugar lactone lactonase YvrE